MLLGRHATVVARNKLGLSDDWQIYAFDRIDDTDATKVKLGIPTKLGNGDIVWGEKERLAVITEAEVAAEFARYEAETGNCGMCLGEKEIFARWHYKDGFTTKPCPRCCSTEEVA